MPWRVIDPNNPEPPKQEPQAGSFFERHRDGFVVVIGTLIAAGCFAGIAKHYAAHAPKSERMSYPMRAAASAPAPK